MCGSVGPSKGIISVSGFLEFYAAQTANSSAHVLHKEPGTLWRWHAYATRKTYPAWLELLWILHGSGTEANRGWAASLHRKRSFVRARYIEQRHHCCKINDVLLFLNNHDYVCVCMRGWLLHPGGACFCFWDVAAVWRCLGPIRWTRCSLYTICS